LKITIPPSTSGELEKPHVGIFAPGSFASSRCHNVLPVAASSAQAFPLRVKVKTVPPSTVGVALGPPS
jgi:hypothetical protein